ncbi:MAG: M1 family metallopeptidase [Bacteroidetes bacterium]|nr:M1 family metallopeptidase [Bacteroidota bacterium]
MKRLILIIMAVLSGQGVWAQEWGKKFEQLGTMLPTPNEYRSASGAPGPAYWQQRADYVIEVELNDDNQTIRGSETITYFNQSPDPLSYIWVQLDQNMRAKDSDSPLVKASVIRGDSVPAYFMAIGNVNVTGYDGGFRITAIKSAAGDALSYTINKTMMRIDLDQELKPDEIVAFSIDWWYNINDRMLDRGRGGMEFFKEDGNYLYTIAQWFPRMAVYSDFEGWQNKQFLGRGEFALNFGNYDVKITVPSDHVVGATGVLQNPKEVLTKEQVNRFGEAKNSFEKPVIIVTQEEAEAKEKSPATSKSTWHFKAENVRDFAFASSRKFIWDAMAVNVGTRTSLAMSYYPKEGNPLWEQESTIAVKNTLETYSKYTIDFPYPKAISVHAASIGMEYPMICFNFGRPNPDGTYSEGTKNRMIGVIIHEVGHNFFPMIINSDERQWTWMDEGLNTFLQYRTEVEKYEDFPSRRGPAKNIVRYMKGDKSNIRPIMTNSEQLLQFGNNAYAKPATAMNILRETVMGPELFDKAFKTYAQRWAFKHPEPADFFRTMEDASAVDLDWFWRGWFYGTDYVDVTVENVKWYKIRDTETALEGRTQKGKIENVANLDEYGNYTDFSNGYELITITDTNPGFYGEFRNTINDDEVRAILAGKNMYEVTLKNTGGLVTPVIIEWTYKDGTKEVERIPAEIWRYNEEQFTKVFTKDKEVVNITIDPFLETADTNVEDNYFPKRETESKFEKFKEGK